MTSLIRKLRLGVPHALRKLALVVFSTLTLGFVFSASAASDIREQVLPLDAQGSAAVTGRIKGRGSVDYTFHARAGQTVIIDFAAKNSAAYFNLLPPASEDALFIGSSSGDHFAGALAGDGQYRIRVYLMRSAARRHEATRYTLKVRLAEAAHAAGFDRTLSLQGIRFHVSSANSGSINVLRIEPAGLEIDNSAIERSIDGNVTNAEIADLDADGSPEVYVYVTSAGSGSYGSLVAYAANRRKSLSEIFLPALDGTPAASGYMGHDEFAVLEGVLGRRFPLYREGDSNVTRNGRMRQLQYKLVPGEASWQLRVDRVVEF